MKMPGIILAMLLLTRMVTAAANTAIEFQHILNCQVSDPGDPAYGAINDIWGEPTWVVPGEMAFAALVLKAGGFTSEAKAAADRQPLAVLTAKYEVC